MVYLKDASSSAVADWLDSYAIFQRDSTGPWLYPGENDPVLYINIHDTDEMEELNGVVSWIEGKPSLAVSVDVSGRHDGTTECKNLVSSLLTIFEGVATDGFSDHCWTLAEIERGKSSDGTLFFDFLGAYRSLQ